MAPFGALSEAWTAAEAANPYGWELVGLWKLGDEWIALADGPNRDYLDASGRCAEHALRRPSDRLRARRGVASG